ncbi:LANO_0G03422g1_1 [Lachancea nothofagi CBS 11611]|uniref:Ribosomal RNA-processing protein 43 n=1 Tax=Lachancea nothofagi CBS 11611 TaxID=1266666 RepID=A0A1G4KFG7_9SACH|nr:LANO_0G03422g1_1 [Lachancea nothofagi CBS 11611]
MSKAVEVRPMTFYPEVLARIAPDLSMQRHLSLGLRPSLRASEEFRNVEISDGKLSCASKETVNRSGNNILGSNVLKCGKTMIVTSITGGVVEENVPVEQDDEEPALENSDADRASQFGCIYPVVEVECGRAGAPTDEEMTLSQRIYNCFLHSGLLSKEALKVSVGVKSTNADGQASIQYPDEKDSTDLAKSFKPRRKWTYVLYAKIQVFSRDGPLFELCWNSLIYALQTTQLPRAFVDERTTDLKIPVSMRGRSAAIRETFDILCDPVKFQPLKLNAENISFASNFAVIELDPEAQLPKDDDDMQVDSPTSVLLADIQGEAEEASVSSIVSVVTGTAGNMKHFKAIGGDSKITLDMIKKSIKLAKLRSSDLEGKS